LLLIPMLFYYGSLLVWSLLMLGPLVVLATIRRSRGDVDVGIECKYRDVRYALPF